MTVTVSEFTSTVGYVIECRGAQVRTQLRSVALVITVAGRLDETNAELVGESIRRFTALGSPLVADLSGVDVGDERACDRLLTAFDADCARCGVGWVLVAPSGARCRCGDDAQVLRADSVAEALQHFVLSIRARRTMSLAPGRGVRSRPGDQINWAGDGAPG
jgi:anti-anti-sigma regulatory factor